MSKKIELDIAKLTQYASEGMHYDEIAKFFGVTKDVVYNRMREYNIPYTPSPRSYAKYKFNMDKEEMQKYLDMHLTYRDIAEKWENDTGEHVPEHIVGDRARKLGCISEGNKYYMRTDNPAKRDEVRAKISESVTKLWEEGSYDSRVNGMAGVTETAHPNYIISDSIHDYIQKARFYHPEARCLCCGKQLDWNARRYTDNAIYVHHVDRDHNNFTLTNLMPLCLDCHTMYHKDNQFFTTVTKCFSFDAAHYLPFHDRKCKFIHGHTYHMEITVRNIIRLDTGMVMDFSQLKEAVKDNILDKFDHGFLNEYIPYSTCECMVFWIWRELSKDVKGLYQIKLQETDGSFAILTLEDYKQCISKFESAWHYSKCTDSYDIDESHVINDGKSSYFKSDVSVDSEGNFIKGGNNV